TSARSTSTGSLPSTSSTCTGRSCPARFTSPEISSFSPGSVFTGMPSSCATSTIRWRISPDADGIAISTSSGSPSRSTQRRHDDATRGSPHVARRDVAPPAVVEAEDDEHRELDPEHDRERLPREEVLVEGRDRLVEADPEREPPCDCDQDRVGDQIEDPV